MPLLANAASYTVVELPTNNLSINQFANSIDNTGLMLTTVNIPFNPPIDLSLIDLSQFSLTDPDAAAQGNFNAADLALVVTVIKQSLSDNSILVQQIANNIGYKTDGTDLSYVNGFDVMNDDTNGYSFALDTTLTDSVNGTHIIGNMEGPFVKKEFVNASDDNVTYVVNDFSTRGFVQVNDQVTELVPENLSAGGFSRAYAINSNLQVAGTLGVSTTSGFQTSVDSCDDDELRGDQPIDACLAGLRAGASTIGNDEFALRFNKRAAVWQVDASGSVISKAVYGILFDSVADSEFSSSSQANDINNAGVAVGYSSVFAENYTNDQTDAAVVFENGEITRLLEDDDLLPNLATGINDNDYIVGYRGVVINNVSRTKMFVINPDKTPTFVPGFFVSSTTIPRAINNNNLVVGDGEPDATQSSRGRNGFLYDIEKDTFTNVNSLIACDSNFTIIGANDINDNNEILADALIRKPARNVKGEIIINDNGEEILLDTVVAVRLIPTGQEPAICAPSEEEILATERQGAGLGIVSVIGLLMIAFLRRRFSFV